MSTPMNPAALFDIKGKVAVVTGASGAFGAVAARVFAAAGARLLLTAGKASQLQSIADECQSAGEEVETVNRRPGSEAACADIIDAADIAKQGPMAVRMAKIALNASSRTGQDTGFLIEQIAQAVLFDSADKEARMTAFLEKRKGK